MTSKQVDRTQELLRPGPDVLALRALDDPDHRVDRRRSSVADRSIAEANRRALKAGYAFGETTEMLPRDLPGAARRSWPRARTGTSPATRPRPSGFLVAAACAKRDLFYGSYPITPATDILQYLATYKSFGVRTFQAEDEIAAMGATIGAAFGGALAVTGTTGPGVALKTEAMGLAVMTELPVVIVNVQRAGPSTGLPTKVEQADLFQALFGRNGEAPMPVLAPATPGECFTLAVEASRLALRYMTPVMYLSRRVRRQRCRALAGPGPRRPAGHLDPQCRQGRGHLPPVRP